MNKQIKAIIRQLLPKNAFARGVGVLVGGTASAQILLVLAAPLLTRLYSPENFGLLSVYGSLLASISVIASLCYEVAIPLPKDDQEAANIVMLCLILVIVSTIFTIVLIVFFSQPLVQLVGIPEIADYFWLLPLGVFLDGVYTIFNYWGIRTKRFTIIANTRIRQAIATLVIQVTVFKLGGVALPIGQTVGKAAGTLSLAMPALTNIKQVNRKDILKVALRYRRLPIFSTWASFSNMAGLQLPPLLFASLFSPVAAGLYSLSHRVLSLPMSLMGNAIGQVFFSKAAESSRNNQLDKLVADLHAQLAHIGMAPAFILILISPNLFALVFGENWRQAGEFARWMIPWLYLVFVSSPLSTLFNVMEKELQGLAFQSILLVSRVSAIIFGALFVQDIMMTVMLFTAISAVCWFGFLLWMTRVVGISPFTIMLPTLSAFGIALLITSPILLTLLFHETFFYSWHVAVIISSFFVSIRYWQLLRKVY